MKKYKSAELKEILEDICGIFDMVYFEYADDETKELINRTEDRLHKFLQEEGLITEEA